MRQDCFVSILRDPVVDRLSYVGNHIFIVMSLSGRHLQDLGFLVSDCFRCQGARAVAENKNQKLSIRDS